MDPVHATPPPPPKLVPPGPPAPGRWLLGGDDTGGAFALRECDLGPGAGVPPHVHRDEDVTVYVLAGAVEVGCGAAVAVLAAGGCGFLPRGVPHRVRNLSAVAPARVLVLMSPPVTQAMLDEVAELAADGGPPDAALVAEVAAFYGLTFLPDAAGGGHGGCDGAV